MGFFFVSTSYDCVLGVLCDRGTTTSWSYLFDFCLHNAIVNVGIVLYVQSKPFLYISTLAIESLSI